MSAFNNSLVCLHLKVNFYSFAGSAIYRDLPFDEADPLPDVLQPETVIFEFGIVHIEPDTIIGIFKDNFIFFYMVNK